MNILEPFWISEENQRKYGFQYSQNGSGDYSVYYDGDVSELMDIAFKELGYVENGIARPVPKDDSLTIIDYGVDGIGEAPNFFIRISDGGNSETIRFNLSDPEYYPADFKPSVVMSGSTLTRVNNIMREHNLEFYDKWNSLRPDCPVQSDGWTPNYRAINRIKLLN